MNKVFKSEGGVLFTHFCELHPHVSLLSSINTDNRRVALLLSSFQNKPK